MHGGMSVGERGGGPSAVRHDHARRLLVGAAPEPGERVSVFHLERIGEDEDIARAFHPRQREHVIFRGPVNGRGYNLPASSRGCCPPGCGRFRIRCDRNRRTLPRSVPGLQRRTLKRGAADIAAVLHVVHAACIRPAGEKPDPQPRGRIVGFVLHVTDIVIVKIAGILDLRQHRLFLVVEAFASPRALTRPGSEPAAASPRGSQ